MSILRFVSSYRTVRTAQTKETPSQDVRIHHFSLCVPLTLLRCVVRGGF